MIAYCPSIFPRLLTRVMRAGSVYIRTPDIAERLRALSWEEGHAPPGCPRRHQTHDCTRLPPIQSRAGKSQRVPATVNVEEICKITQAIYSNDNQRFLVNGIPQKDEGTGEELIVSQIDQVAEKRKILLSYLQTCLQTQQSPLLPPIHASRRTGYPQTTREESVLKRFQVFTTPVIDLMQPSAIHTVIKAKPQTPAQPWLPPRKVVRTRRRAMAGPSREQVVDILEKPLQNRSSEDIQILFRGLRHLKAFNNLSNFALVQLLGVLHLNVYAPNRIVFKQGDEGSDWHVILQGKVDILVAGGQNYGNSLAQAASVQINDDDSAGRLADLVRASRALVRLGEGEGFGELALVSDSKRAATIMTVEPCYILRIEKGDYNRIIRSMHEREHYLKILFLRKCPILQEFSDLKIIANVTTMKKFPKGSLIQDAGKPILEVVFISSGKCAVFAPFECDNPPSLIGARSIPTGPFCANLLIGHLGPGEYFGEAVALNNPRDPFPLSQASLNRVPSSSRKDGGNVVRSPVIVKCLTDVEVCSVLAHDARLRLRDVLKLTPISQLAYKNDRLMKVYLEQEDLRLWRRYKKDVLQLWVKERSGDPNYTLKQFHNKGGKP
ncbi:hypothetical protein DFS34DRAFT_89345 [Phlyctochytrium arcticum]|nr:hypothetical protein DFS34DRAFT_89345 [Phlyctochytrium arcticum]